MQQICFIGLGYIGLPTAAVAASKGSVIETINSGRIHIIEPGLSEVVQAVVQSQHLRASTKPEASSVYLIVVPTPFKDGYTPDISYVEAATISIIDLLKENDLYIIESTSPVGTTEKMARLIYQRRPELQGKIRIAYCPERVLPGQTELSTTQKLHLWRNYSKNTQVTSTK